jgi:hypothetical protein
MAASSWATYEASKALLAEHGSVAAVKAAAAAKPAVVTPLTVGLDKWSAIDAAIVEAAKDVDIVIPVRQRCAGAAPQKGPPLGDAPLRAADAPLRAAADDPQPGLLGAVARLLAAVPPDRHPGARCPFRRGWELRALRRCGRGNLREAGPRRGAACTTAQSYWFTRAEERRSVRLRARRVTAPARAPLTPYALAGWRPLQAQGDGAGGIQL